MLDATYRCSRVAASVAMGVALLALSACSPPPLAGDGVEAYVDRAIQLMEDHGLYAGSPEWTAAVSEKRIELENRESIGDTYSGLADLARIAGGEHSTFLTPTESEAATAPYSSGSGFAVPTVSTTNAVGILTLPAFNGIEQDAIDRYQNAGVDAIRSAAAATTCGWIIDLRSNSGGNAWPMLSAVAPLLSDGEVFGQQDRDGETGWAEVENGNLFIAGAATAQADFAIHQPVALLIGDLTASAGEVAVVAFAGQSDTARFGGSTAGLTTGNRTFELEDGATLILSVSHYVDRTGALYDGPIAADVAVPDWRTPAAADAAAEWLRERC